MASIAASTGEDAAAIGEDTRVPGADAEHGGSNPRDSHISEQDEMFQQDASHMRNRSLSRRVSRRLSIRRSRYSSVDRANELLDREGQCSDNAAVEPTKADDMQEYLSKLQQLHAGGLLYGAPAKEI